MHSSIWFAAPLYSHMTSDSCRTWHPRRLALTKDVLFLLHPGSTKIVDAIPLFELEDVAFMQDISKEGGSKSDSSSKKDIAESRVEANGKPPDIKEKKNGKSNMLKFSHSFQLRTPPDGYNTGRQYIIQAHSDPECLELAEQIRQLAKVSTETYLAKSRFLKAQANFLHATEA